MLGTHKTIKSLADLYTKHVQDIKQIPKIQQRFGDLEKQCRYKDERIKSRKIQLKLDNRNYPTKLVGSINKKDNFQIQFA